MAYTADIEETTAVERIRTLGPEHIYEPRVQALCAYGVGVNRKFTMWLVPSSKRRITF